MKYFRSFLILLIFITFLGNYSYSGFNKTVDDVLTTNKKLIHIGFCSLVKTCNVISSFGKIVAYYKKSDTYERTIRVVDDRIFYVAGIISSGEQVYDNKYLIRMEKKRFMLWDFKIYKMNGNKIFETPLYQNSHFDTVLLDVMPVKNGFITESRGGIGRKKLYQIFIENKGKMRMVSEGSYDFLELAYFKNYNGMPHLFFTNCNYPCNTKDKLNDNMLYSYTDVFEWDTNGHEYKKIKSLRYNKSMKFEDRFCVKSNEKPIFNKNRYL